MSKVTLRTIAEKTGLSKYAVSRALSGKSGVSEATRARVVATAEKMGYTPPRTTDTHLIGAVFNNSESFNSEIHMQIQAGVQEEASRLGYAFQLHWMRDVPELLEFASGCSALVTVNVPDEPHSSELNKLGIPIVRNGWLSPLDPVSSVGGTDHEAGSAVADHLVGLGHREFVYVHGPIDLRGRRERLYGLSEALERIPDTVLHDVVWDTDGSFTDRLDKLIEAGARPTAYYCAHDDLALTAITGMMARGWRIPDDVSVVGFGDFSAARYVRPPLTTVRTNCADMGRAAVRLLNCQLTQSDWPKMPWRVRIPCTFVERQSTGPAPSNKAQDRLFGSA